MKPRHIIILPLLLIAGTAFAEKVAGGAGAAATTDGAISMFQAAAMDVNRQLIRPALATACAALMLQWIFTYYKEIFNPEMNNIISKMVGLISWFSISVIMINSGSEKMADLFAAYLSLSSNLTGLPVSGFSPSGMLQSGLDTMKALHVAVVKGSGFNLAGLGDSLIASFQLVFVDVFILIAYIVIALGLFVAQLEFWMMFSVAPLAFAMIPLSAFRDQGIAPIKGMMSLGLRILILGVVVAVTQKMSAAIIAELNTNGLAANGILYGPVAQFLAAMAGCTMMAMSAGKIASSIASGSASFSGADAIKTGAAMTATAAVGAAGIASAVAGAGPAISKGSEAIKSASGAMSGAMGGSPSVSNAASGGFGGSPVQQRPSAAPSGAAGGAGAGAGAAGAGAGAAGAGAGAAGAGAGAGAGDATTAGIGGAGSTVPPGGPSAMDKLGGKIGQLAEHGSQDQHAVNISINMRGD